MPILAGAHRRRVLIADVDGFSAINDARGHAAGDDVLRSLAGLLRELTPAGGRASGSATTRSRSLFEAPPRSRAGGSAGSCARSLRRRLGTTLSIGVAVGEPTDSVVPSRAGASDRSSQPSLSADTAWGRA